MCLGPRDHSRNRTHQSSKSDKGVHMVSKFEENANFSQVYEHVVVASMYLIGIRL